MRTTEGHRIGSGGSYRGVGAACALAGLALSSLVCSWGGTYFRKQQQLDRLSEFEVTPISTTNEIRIQEQHYENAKKVKGLVQSLEKLGIRSKIFDGSILQRLVNFRDASEYNDTYFYHVSGQSRDFSYADIKDLAWMNIDAYGGPFDTSPNISVPNASPYEPLRRHAQIFSVDPFALDVYLVGDNQPNLKVGIRAYNYLADEPLIASYEYPYQDLTLIKRLELYEELLDKFNAESNQLKFQLSQKAYHPRNPKVTYLPHAREIASTVTGDIDVSFEYMGPSLSLGETSERVAPFFGHKLSNNHSKDSVPVFPGLVWCIAVTRRLTPKECAAIFTDRSKVDGKNKVALSAGQFIGHSVFFKESEREKYQQILIWRNIGRNNTPTAKKTDAAPSRRHVIDLADFGIVGKKVVFFEPNESGDKYSFSIPYVMP